MIIFSCLKNMPVLATMPMLWEANLRYPKQALAHLNVLRMR